jgi:hypothetical protein
MLGKSVLSAINRSPLIKVSEPSREVIKGNAPVLQTLGPNISRTVVKPVVRPVINEPSISPVIPRPMDPSVVAAVVAAEKQNDVIKMNVSTGQAATTSELPSVIPMAPAGSFGGADTKPSSIVSEAVNYTLGNIAENVQQLDEYIVTPQKNNTMMLVIIALAAFLILKK